jgi:hypothetical protein
MLQNIILNIVAFFFIVFVYSLILSISQNILADFCSVLKIFPIRNVAKITSAISAIVASIIPIIVASYGLSYMGKALSIFTVITWLILQKIGIARDFMGHEASMEEILILIRGQAEEGAFRMKYFGQFFGTILGTIIGIILHYTLINPL